MKRGDGNWEISEWRLRYFGWLITIRHNVDAPPVFKWQARRGHAGTRRNITGYATSLTDAKRQAVGAVRGAINARAQR